MKKNSDFYFKLVLIGLDVLALVGAFTAAYIMRVSLDTRPFHVQIGALEFITSIVLMLPLWVVLDRKSVV